MRPIALILFILQEWATPSISLTPIQTLNCGHITRRISPSTHHHRCLGRNGVISGTPSVYAVNQTYTIYANQSGETTTFDMYFSVDTNNPHTVVENQPIDAIGFQDPFQNGTTNWTVSPALPADLVMDPNTGEITGSVNGVLANTTYTVNATRIAMVQLRHSPSACRVLQTLMVMD